jgi:hypothetical protein
MLSQGYNIKCFNSQIEEKGLELGLGLGLELGLELELALGLELGLWHGFLVFVSLQHQKL